MALLGGHRFKVSMADVFPHGCYALSVAMAEDFDEKVAQPPPRCSARPRRSP